MFKLVILKCSFFRADTYNKYCFTIELNGNKIHEKCTKYILRGKGPTSRATRLGVGFLPPTYVGAMPHAANLRQTPLNDYT